MSGHTDREAGKGGPTKKGAARVSDDYFLHSLKYFIHFLNNLYLFYTCVFSTGVHVGVRVLSLQVDSRD